MATPLETSLAQQISKAWAQTERACDAKWEREINSLLESFPLTSDSISADDTPLVRLQAHLTSMHAERKTLQEENKSLKEFFKTDLCSWKIVRQRCVHKEKEHPQQQQQQQRQQDPAADVQAGGEREGEGDGRGETVSRRAGAGSTMRLLRANSAPSASPSERHVQPAPSSLASSSSAAAAASVSPSDSTMAVSTAQSSLPYGLDAAALSLFASPHQPSMGVESHQSHPKPHSIQRSLSAQSVSAATLALASPVVAPVTFASFVPVPPPAGDRGHIAASSSSSSLAAAASPAAAVPSSNATTPPHTPRPQPRPLMYTSSPVHLYDEDPTSGSESAASQTKQLRQDVFSQQQSPELLGRSAPHTTRAVQAVHPSSSSSLFSSSSSSASIMSSSSSSAASLKPNNDANHDSQVTLLWSRQAEPAPAPSSVSSASPISPTSTQPPIRGQRPAARLLEAAASIPESVVVIDSGAPSLSPDYPPMAFHVSPISSSSCSSSSCSSFTKPTAATATTTSTSTATSVLSSPPPARKRTRDIDTASLPPSCTAHATSTSSVVKPASPVSRTKHTSRSTSSVRSPPLTLVASTRSSSSSCASSSSASSSSSVKRVKRSRRSPTPPPEFEESELPPFVSKNRVLHERGLEVLSMSIPSDIGSPPSADPPPRHHHPHPGPRHRDTSQAASGADHRQTDLTDAKGAAAVAKAMSIDYDESADVDAAISEVIVSKEAIHVPHASGARAELEHCRGTRHGVSPGQTEHDREPSRLHRRHHHHHHHHHSHEREHEHKHELGLGLRSVSEQSAEEKEDGTQTLVRGVGERASAAEGKATPTSPRYHQHQHRSTAENEEVEKAKEKEREMEKEREKEEGGDGDASENSGRDVLSSPVLVASRSRRTDKTPAPPLLSRGLTDAKLQGAASRTDNVGSEYARTTTGRVARPSEQRGREAVAAAVDVAVAVDVEAEAEAEVNRMGDEPNRVADIDLTTGVHVAAADIDSACASLSVPVDYEDDEKGEEDEAETEVAWNRVQRRAARPTPAAPAAATLDLRTSLTARTLSKSNTLSVSSGVPKAGAAVQSTPRPSAREAPYQEVVRNRAERERLGGYDCTQCEEFYRALGASGNDEDEDAPIKVTQLRQLCSRHRYRFAPAQTPVGYYGLDSPSGVRDCSDSLT